MKRQAVLLIEDAPDLLEDMPVVLKSYDMDCHATTDYDEAVQLVKQGVYDCVILDIKMPPSKDMSNGDTDDGRLTGILVCKRLRQVNSGIPIVVVTSVRDPNAHSMARNAGANAIVVKPCYPDDIVQHIKRFTDNRAGPSTR